MIIDDQLIEYTELREEKNDFFIVVNRTKHNLLSPNFILFLFERKEISTNKKIHLRTTYKSQKQHLKYGLCFVNDIIILRFEY